MNNKQLTIFCAFGISIASMILFMYMFSAFISGYTVTWKEPNIAIASIELISGIIFLPIITKIFYDFAIKNE